MTVSAFGMCCGYYQKVLNNQISWSDFYGKRFKKILPFFALLVLLDVAMSHSLGSIYEGFADLTLVFGFLPADIISVIGVGWFLGLIFVFYLIFPFFCVLICNITGVAVLDILKDNISAATVLIVSFVINGIIGVIRKVIRKFFS